MLSVKQDSNKYLFFFFLVFGMTQPEIEPGSLGPLANALTIRPKTLNNSKRVDMPLNSIN